MTTQNKGFSFSLPKKPVYHSLKDRMSPADFVRLFEEINRSFDTCVLLESLEGNSYESRYSIIGFDPDYTIRTGVTSLIITGRNQTASTTLKTDNPYYALREFFPQDSISRNYAGGLIGSITYEAMRYFESAVECRLPDGMDYMIFGLYTDGIVHDKYTGELFYFHYTESRLKEVLTYISASKSAEVPKQDNNAHCNITPKGQSMTQEEHREAVIKTQEEVRAGNTFQCQIGFKRYYTITGDSFEIYKKLRTVNPSPYMFYLKFGKKQYIGASPELLFRLQDGHMETYPLAGTARRGETPEEDLNLVHELLHNPKEIAEHNMLVDLHRNDIGRVSRFGTVLVRKYMDIKKFSHVQHISSEISGLIDPRYDMFEALAANFPAGTLSGAPKIESMKIIHRLENTPRGPYGGAIGHFGFNGDCTFCIPIRSLFIEGENAFTQASSGIVYDSDADLEYQEVCNKLAGMERAMADFME